MGSLFSHQRVVGPASRDEHERLFIYVQEAKLCGRLVPPPLIENSSLEHDLIQNPEQEWSLDYDEAPGNAVIFKFPKNWDFCHPVRDGPRWSAVVRCGYKSRESYIFCDCELSVTVTALDKFFNERKKYFDEMILAARATCERESDVLVQDQGGFLEMNVRYSQDADAVGEGEIVSTVTTIRNRHYFIAKPPMGVSVLAFFANEDAVHRFGAIVDAFFSKVRVKGHSSG